MLRASDAWAVDGSAPEFRNLNRLIWAITGALIAAPIAGLWAGWVVMSDAKITALRHKEIAIASCAGGQAWEELRTGKIVCAYGSGRSGSPLLDPIKGM